MEELNQQAVREIEAILEKEGFQAATIVKTNTHRLNVLGVLETYDGLELHFNVQKGRTATATIPQDFQDVGCNRFRATMLDGIRVRIEYTSQDGAERVYEAPIKR